MIDNIPVYDRNAAAITQSVNARLGLEQISLLGAPSDMVATVHTGQLTTNIPLHFSKMTLGIGQIDVTDKDETDTKELYQVDGPADQNVENDDNPDDSDQESILESQVIKRKRNIKQPDNARKEMTKQRMAEVERQRIEN